MPTDTDPAEQAMLLPTLRGLIRLGIASQMTRAAVEVPWYQKRLDLVLVEQDAAVAVELKVSKWRSAIDQAYVNRWVASASWAAIWHKRLTLEAHRYAAESGVGLLAVTRNTVYPLIAPSPPPRRDDMHRLHEPVLGAGTRIRDLISYELKGSLALA